MWQIWNTSFPLAECLLILSELPKLTLPTKTRFYYFLLLLAVEKKIQLLEDEKDFILGYLPSKEMLIKLSVQNITVDASTQNNPAWLSVFIRFHSMFFSSCSGNKTKQRQCKENQPLKKLLDENVPWKTLENNSHEMKVLVVTSNQRARQCQAGDPSDQCLCSHF